MRGRLPLARTADSAADPPAEEWGSMARIRIGTAGWSLDRSMARFGQEGSALERYATVLDGVEINSSFYRRHRLATWQRWHDAVPEDFRFSLKLPKRISHELALVGCDAALVEFFADVAPLAQKLGPVLLQLPPKLAYEEGTVGGFLAVLRRSFVGQVTIEPRHESWATPAASALFKQFQISRVWADPQSGALRLAAEAEPSPYLRLHGSPKVYYSSYDEAALSAFAAQLSAAPAGAWCIFDNTASGAALSNAVALRDRLI